MAQAGKLLERQLQRCQQFQQRFPSPFGFHREQHPALEQVQEATKLGQRLGAVHIHDKLGQALHRQVLAAGLLLAGQALQGNLGITPQGGKQLFHRLVEGRGRQQRPIGIVAPIFVALIDVCPELLAGLVQIAQGQQQAVGRQVVQQAGAALEEQRQISYNFV